MQFRSISNRTVEALKVDKDTVFWDRELSGFGVRVYPSGGKVFIVQVRGPSGAKRVTVGRHGVLHAGQARKRGALIIARLKAGETLTPELSASMRSGGPTIAELAKRYLEDHVEIRNRPATNAMVRIVVNRHIIPTLGKFPVLAVERAHVIKLHHRLCETPFMANAVISRLSLMYRLAEGWGLVPEGFNPCRQIVKYPEPARERFLTHEEFKRLARALDEVETLGGASPSAVAALRLLMLTGCRRNEILTLRWEDVALDRRELTLRDAKTGPRVVPLSPSAVGLLSVLPRVRGNPWVLPGLKPGTHLRNLDGAWRVLRARAELDDVRVHDLRHSFASRALALGETLPMIGKLLGHNQVETTARYAHLARDSIHESAERIAESIAEDIMPRRWQSHAA